MASVTVWPARRVGDRILCGRPAPDGGCRGEIATIVPSGRYPILPTGMVEDPPGSRFWRLTARAQRQIATLKAEKREQLTGLGNIGRRTTMAVQVGSLGDNRMRPRDAPVFLPPALPLRRRCPVCNTVAEVTASLLNSPSK
jgi:hypothetical protein